MSRGSPLTPVAEFSRDPHALGDATHDQTERLLRDARLPELTPTEQRALAERGRDDQHVSRYDHN